MSETKTVFPIEVALFINENDVQLLVGYFAGYNLKMAEHIPEENKKLAARNFIRLYKLLTVEQKMQFRQEIENFENVEGYSKQAITNLLDMIKDNL